jgi:hypothetical protein
MMTMMMITVMTVVATATVIRLQSLRHKRSGARTVWAPSPVLITLKTIVMVAMTITIEKKGEMNVVTVPLAPAPRSLSPPKRTTHCQSRWRKGVWRW